MSIWEGCATTVFLSWTTGIALIGYMKGVGATSEQVMLIALIPQLMQAVSPLGAWLLSRYPRPKLLIVTGTLIARSLFLIPALLPLLFYESFIREGGNPRLVWGVLALLAITQFFQCATGPIWLDWMASLVPQQRRGPYFGLRNGICGIVGLCAHLGGMMLLDYLQAPQNFQVLFAAGVLFAWLGIFLYTRQHEPQLNIARISLTRTFLEPLADRNFLRFLRYAVYWQAAVMLGATYLFDFFFEVQKFTFTQLGIYQAIAAFSSLVLGPLWGRLAMRVGNKAVLTFTTMIAASALPMTWLLMTPGDPTLLYLSGFIDAFAWSAINPAIVNLALVTAPPNKRAAYMSVMSLAQGLAGALGALLSWALLGMAQQFTFTLGRYEWTAYHWVFVVSISIRSFAFLLIAPIHESKAWRVRDVMRAFLAWRFTGFPWR
ncbi:MAG TPA: MFS transporter [Salinarimonas sp.]|nr:MFS transporter [Salinarimonas sp.]